MESAQQLGIVCGGNGTIRIAIGQDLCAISSQPTKTSPSVVGVVTKVMVVAASSEEWQAWKVQHGRSYNSIEEDALRKSIFDANVATIQNHNAKHLSLTMAVNKFSDHTPAALTTMYAGLKGSAVHGPANLGTCHCRCSAGL